VFLLLVLVNHSIPFSSTLVNIIVQLKSSPAKNEPFSGTLQVIFVIVKNQKKSMLMRKQ
jgi:hypothetical protein